MLASAPEWLTADLVRELLSYDAATGEFRWRRYMNRLARAGQIAGKKTATGYWSICIRLKHVMAHRLAWLVTHGAWPSGEVDHIDCNRANNAIGNLRVVTRSENMQNQGARKPGPAGFMGVTWNRGRWTANIGVSGRRINLGRFDDPGEAGAAYQDAKSRLHIGGRG